MTVSIPENKSQENSVQEKVVQSEIKNPETQNLAQTSEKQKTETKTSEEDPNFRAFREARKKDTEARKEAERKAAEKEQEVLALKAAMEAAFSKSSPTPQAYQQYYGMSSADSEEETEDQRIEKKVNALLAQREEKARREYEEKEKREYPNRLIRELPDFNQVVSQENLDYIDYHYPEISRPLQRLPDGYDKWEDIYRAIKKFVPNNTTARKEAAKAEANFNKPKSISSAQVTQSGDSAPRSMIEIEQRRAENWARMNRIMKQV